MSSAGPWDAVIPSVITSIATVTVLWLGRSGLRELLLRHRYAFTLELGMGPVWYLKKLRRPIATAVSYRVMKRDLTERDPLLHHDEVGPGPGYGIWNIEEGDTFEIYWSERGRQYSTFQMIFPGERSIRLRRENKGH